MKQLPREKAAQRKIKWLFEGFSASLHCLVHLLAQLLRQHILLSRVCVKKVATKEKTGFENKTRDTLGSVGIKGNNRPSKITE